MKSNFFATIIKYLYYTLFFIVPFIVYPATSELFEFNKMIFIYAIAACIGWAWTMRSFQQKRFIFRKTPFDIPILIFFVSQILSMAFSIDVFTSFFGYYGRFNGGVLSLFTYIFLFYALVSNLGENLGQIVRPFYILSVISSLIVILWGLPGKMDHDLSCLLFTSKFDNNCWTTQFRPAERMFSTLGQPNWLGAYLAITFFMGLYLFLTSSTKRKLYGGFMILNYIGILFTRSRSALASLIPGLIIFFVVIFLKNRKKEHKEQNSLYKGIMSLVVAMTLVTLLFKTGIPQVDSLLGLDFLRHTQKVSQLTQAPAAPGSVTESFDIRKIVWEGALELGMQYPLFGTGVETFGYSYYSVRPLAHNMTSEWDYLYNKAHNEYLNFFATTGWLGLLSVIFFIGWIGMYMVKRLIAYWGDTNRLYLILTIGAIWGSIILTNFFGFSITIINLYWYVLPAFLLIGTFSDEKPKKEYAIPLVGFILPFIIWVYCMNFIFSYWLADYRYAVSDSALKSNNIQAAVNLLQQALSLRKDHVYEDKLSYALSQLAFYSSYQKQTEQASQYLAEAEKLNLSSIRQSSQNILYWKTRVKNQYLFYQMTLDKKYLFTGLSALTEASRLGPTDPKIPYFSATYYALLFDEEKNLPQKNMYGQKALDAIQSAIRLKPNYADAFYLKVQLLKKFNRKQEAKELLNWYINNYAQDNRELQKELNEM